MTNQLTYIPPNLKSKVNSLVKSMCANYFDHYNECIILGHDCPQLTSNHQICKYFKTAVLPTDKTLYNQIIGNEIISKCVICGKPFEKKNNRSKNCEICSKKERQNSQKEWVRNKRNSLVHVDI